METVVAGPSFPDESLSENIAKARDEMDQALKASGNPKAEMEPPMTGTAGVASEQVAQAVFHTTRTLGGSVINVAGNYIVQGGYERPGADAIETRQRLAQIGVGTEVHLLPSLLPFNDAPVDLISSCFTGRHEDIQFIANVLGSPTGRAPARYAIWGMPGLGKSQTALKYAHSYFESGRYTHVFWIPATTVEKLMQGLAKVLQPVQHLERYNPDQAVQLMAARDCFEHSEKYGFVKWLIIFDDATSETVSFLRQNLPRQNANGSILITTRTLDVAEALTNVAGQQHPVYELKALSPVQSAELLLKRAGIHGSSATADLESAQELVQRMGCLPLAVEQAGAFMKANGFSSTNRLNDMYNQHGSAEIIRWKNSLTAYEQTSVLAAFTAPLQRLGTINPNVLSLLRVLACFDPEHIPLDIVVLGAEKARVAHLASHAESTLTVSQAPKNKQFGFGRLIAKLSGKRATPRPLTVPQSDTLPLELIPLLDPLCSEEWLRGACTHLKDLSLAQPLYGEKTSLHIHDLIRQVIVQQTMVAHESGENMYHSFAVILLSEAFLTIEDPASPQSWTECERFVPHLMSLVNHAGALPINLLGVLTVHIAHYFGKRGRYEEAVALFQHVLAGQTQQLGADHLETLVTVNNLAEMYRQQGKYDKAQPLYQRALAGQTQQLSADHLGTLTTVNNLALLYNQQGKYNKAEPLYQRALAGCEKQLGAGHPSTLTAVQNIAGMYRQQGKYNEAEPLYQRALAGQMQQLGADHPDTLGTVNNLAELYRQQGKYDKAQPLYQRALAGQTQQLGAVHPGTLRTVNNLAMLYHQQGKYDEAKSLYQRALAGQMQQLGADHPSTFMMVNNLAELYRQQGKHDEAEPLYQRALAGQTQQLGADHPDTLRTVGNLALLYHQQGKYDEAEPLLQQALVGVEQQLGADHPDTLRMVGNLAELYCQQRKYDEAEPLYQRALAGQMRQLGADHPGTLTTVNNLALLYSGQGKYDKAVPLCQRALAGCEQQLGADHPDTLGAVNNLALLYSQQGKHDEAEPLYQQALAGQAQQLGADHPDTLGTVSNLALLYHQQGKYDEAEPLYQRARAGFGQRLGAGHPNTLTVVSHLACMYDEQGRAGEAKNLRARAEEVEKVQSSK
ncbi:TPR-like protein [Athelia psychrophila]|uniref:TPR-like protein n=1 Tax=Athelia psychrophila TaxID=1759441 RepID=A0A166W8T6_9AGAM|nr:TPR-like protein [Fibularhizoctonia sp. CBS 109695]